MKIVVNRDSLIKALDVVGTALGNKVIIDSFRYIMFDVKDNKCYIYARNEQMQIRAFINVEAKGKFKFCVPGNKITETVRLISDEDVTLTTKVEENGSFTTMLTIKGKKNRYKNAGIDPEEYGTMDIGKDAKGFSLHMSSLVKEFANSQLPVQPGNLVQMLTGVNISSSDKGFSIVGANNSFMYKGLLDSSGIDINMTIPKSIAAAVAMMPISPAAKIGTDGTHVVIKSGSVQITAILINGNYPNTSQFFDGYNNDNYIVVNRQQMIKSMKVLRLYSTTEDRAMVVSVDGDELTLSGRNDAMTSSAEEVIDIENHGVEDGFKIAFNPTMVLPAITNIESDTVKIHLISPDKFVFITEEAEEISGYWLVCPIILPKEA
jgi:DNA polymerase III beta subunit